MSAHACVTLQASRAFIRSSTPSASVPAPSWTTSPSRRTTIRSATAAALRLVGDHDHRLARTRRRPGAGGPGPPRRTCESRLPVGSSANSTAGRCTSARATATRCCWPPESSDGRCVSRSRRPTVSISWSSHFWSASLARELQRQRDVLLGGQHRHEVEGLEDEAEPVAAQPRQAAVVEAGELLPVDHHRSGGGLVQPREQVHQRRLPGARRPHDRRELAGGEGQRHAGERVHRGLALAVGTAQVRRRNDVHRRSIVRTRRAMRLPLACGWLALRSDDRGGAEGYP